jgi:hypothetical protein
MKWFDIWYDSAQCRPMKRLEQTANICYFLALEEDSDTAPCADVVKGPIYESNRRHPERKPVTRNETEILLNEQA